MRSGQYQSRGFDIAFLLLIVFSTWYVTKSQYEKPPEQNIQAQLKTDKKIGDGGYYKLNYKDGTVSAWYIDTNEKPHPASLEEIQKLSGLKFPRYEEQQ